MTTSRERRRDRLDRVLVSQGLARTRAKAQALVMAGRVTSEGRRLGKPGSSVPVDAPLAVSPAPTYVSRGGTKLAAALAEFGIDVRGRDAIDVGASTGGFTHVLLESGAGRVIALDVGRGQLDWALSTDPRVEVLEGQNARYLRPENLPFRPSLAVVDVSFLSLEHVLPPIVRCLEPGGEVVALVKPQFEAGRRRVGRGGIVRDPSVHEEVVRRALAFAASVGCGVLGVARSAIKGARGNVEFFVHLAPGRPGLGAAELDQAVRAAVRSAQEVRG